MLTFYSVFDFEGKRGITSTDVASQKKKQIGGVESGHEKKNNSNSHHYFLENKYLPTVKL